MTISDVLVEANAAANGGGLAVGLMSLVLSDSIVRANSVSGVGGGFVFFNGLGTVENTSILDNLASNIGGGLYLQAATLDSITCDWGR